MEVKVIYVMSGGLVGVWIIVVIVMNNGFELSCYWVVKLMVKLKLESC